MRGLLSLTLFFFALEASAEYRVYQYLVKSRSAQFSVTEPQARAVISTLNPVAYRAYHGGSAIDLTLMRTWMCMGFTGQGRAACPAPGERLAKVIPRQTPSVPHLSPQRRP